jgi:hypothetical protein
METLIPTTLNRRPGMPLLRVRCLIGLPRKPRGRVAQLYAALRGSLNPGRAEI